MLVKTKIILTYFLLIHTLQMLSNCKAPQSLAWQHKAPSITHPAVSVPDTCTAQHWRCCFAGDCKYPELSAKWF